MKCLPLTALSIAALSVLLAAGQARAQSAPPASANPAPPPPPAAAAPAPAPSPATATLKVATWGGAYGKAQEQAIVAPFAKSSGLEVSVDATLEGGRERDALGRTPPPDVIELGSLALDEACASGGLLKLDPASLEAAPDGTAPPSDFLPGGLTDCGVASFAWSTVFIADQRAFKGDKPATLEDVFNVWVYPGARALPKKAKYVLEFALLADGVAIEEVHKLLETEDGVFRALSRVGKLGEIVWWDKPSEAFAALADGKATIALGYSGRAFQEIARGRPYDVIWDRQIYEVSFYAVPATAAAPAAARKFISFATSPQRLAAQAKTWPYGPMRRSAIALTDKHVLLGTDLAPFLPTASANFENAVRFDAKWWAANEARLQTAFDTWLAGRKPPETPKASTAPPSKKK